MENEWKSLKFEKFLKEILGIKRVRKLNLKSRKSVKKSRRASKKFYSPAPKGGQTRPPKVTFFEKRSVKKSARYLSNKNLYTERDLRSRSGVCSFPIPHPIISFWLQHWKMFSEISSTDGTFHQLEFSSMGENILSDKTLRILKILILYREILYKTTLYWKTNENHSKYKNYRSVPQCAFSWTR